MSDSSIDDELFADDSTKNKKDSQEFSQPPLYYHTDEFRTFVQQQKIEANANYGYSYISFYKDYYFPGQTVRGYAMINLFNDLPSKKILIRVKGKEIPGKHSREIKRKLIKDPDGFKDEFMTITVNNTQFDKKVVI